MDLIAHFSVLLFDLLLLCLCCWQTLSHEEMMHVMEQMFVSVKQFRQVLGETKNLGQDLDNKVCVSACAG